MVKVLRELRSDHANASRLLGVLAEGVSAAGTGVSPDYVLLLDIMSYMTHYPDLFHHPREELVFRKMVERDPQVRGLLKEVRSEHKVLAEKGTKLLQTLRNIINGFELRPDALLARTEDYIITLNEHMRLEEEKIFPRAKELLSADDWADLEGQLSAREDPLFGRTLKKEYRNLYRHVVSD